jgi:hypothetical protein
MTRPSMLRRSAVALAFATMITPVTGALAVAASPTILLDDLSQHAAVKPSTFMATNTVTLSRLHWSHWGASTTTGTGTLKINNCKPNCARGHIRVLHGAQLQVRGVRLDQGHRYYRQYRIIDRAFSAQDRHMYSQWTNAYVPSDFR